MLVDALLAEVEQAASRFRPDSEVCTLARRPDGSLLLSPMLADLLRTALAVAEDTDGAVDPTVAAALAGLGYDRDIRLVQSGRGLRAVVRPVPGWRTLRLTGRRLEVPAAADLGALVDLGATAKARAADLAAALVAERLGTGCWSASGVTSRPPGPTPSTAGTCWCRTRRRTLRRPCGWSPARPSRPPRRCAARGGAPRAGSTTSSTRHRPDRAVSPWRSVTVSATAAWRPTPPARQPS